MSNPSKAHRLVSFANPRNPHGLRFMEGEDGGTGATEAPTPAPPAQATPTPSTEPPARETDWKAEARKWEQRAKENSEALRAREQEIEDSKKSAEQKAAEALAAAQSSAAEAAAKALRYEVAAEKGLDLALAARLTGSTKEELESDADALMALIPKAPEDPPAQATPSGPTVPGQQPGGSQHGGAQVTQSDLDALAKAGKHDEINKLRREGRLSHLGIAPPKAPA